MLAIAAGLTEKLVELPLIGPSLAASVVSAALYSVTVALPEPSLKATEPGYLGASPPGLLAGPENVSACSPL
jgi:hypothetical protein